MVINLENVTLLGIDCVDINRLIDVSKICTKRINFGAVKLLSSLPSDDKDVIKIEHLASLEECAKFIIKDLYRYIDTDFILLIQYDGYVLNPEAWDMNFMNYDYIGAPWPSDHLDVGNGGFSFRSRKLMELLAKDAFIDDFHPEDGIIGIKYRPYLESKGIRFPSTELAAKFSFEANAKHGLKWNGQFGFHSYSTNLNNWSISEYANALTDSSFISYFLQKTKSRLNVEIIPEAFRILSGVYHGHKFESNICVAEDGARRLDVTEGAVSGRKSFYPVDETTYFSDDDNELLMFAFDDSSGLIRAKRFQYSISRIDFFERKLAPKEVVMISELMNRDIPELKNPFVGSVDQIM